MIQHIALFRFIEGIPASEIDAFEADLRRMASRLPMLRGYECDRALGLRPGGEDFAVRATVDSAADLDAYLDDPEHATVVGRWFELIVAERHAVQLPVTGHSTAV